MNWMTVNYTQQNNKSSAITKLKEKKNGYLKG